MFDFIPVEDYYSYYINILYALTLISAFHLYNFSPNNFNNQVFLKLVSIPFSVLVILYIGLRPLDEIFGDMVTYSYHFHRYSNGEGITNFKDVLFHFFIKFCSGFISQSQFFLLCSFLYIYPLFLVSKKLYDKYWFYAFLMMIGSFSFWGYGVNGIRNGIATSLFLLAFTRDKLVYKIIFFFLAVSFHKSMLLPLAGYILTFFNNDTKKYLWGWFVSIILSLAFPGVWENIFANVIDDERASYLVREVSNDKFSKVGFRWDFLIYSCSGVFAGYYFIVKKGFRESLYVKLYNIFLFANAFWVLVIRANFSNRFAYLSWFMLAIIISYPCFKRNSGIKDRKLAAIIFLAYVSFTYLAYLIGI